MKSSKIEIDSMNNEIEKIEKDLIEADNNYNFNLDKFEEDIVDKSTELKSI